MNWETILCLGDSITIGARSYLGYPEYLGHLLEQQFRNRWNVINHATSGHKTIELHRSITQHFHTLQQYSPSVATILIGTNDLKSPTHPEDFRIAYRQVILKTRLMLGHNNIFLIKIPSLPGQVKYPYRLGMNRTVDEFNAIITALAAEHRITVADIALREEDLFDGVHLNSTGAKHFAEQMLRHILADKGIIQTPNGHEHPSNQQ